MTPEEKKLQEIADQVGMKVKDFYHLLHKFYIGDTNIRENQNRDRQALMHGQQLELMEIQLLNEQMQQRLLSIKLNKAMIWLNRKQKVRNFFKTKKHENNDGVPQS